MQGSGVVIEGNYVLTNRHVVWPDRAVTLVFPDGMRLENVPVVSTEPISDLALLGPIEFVGEPVTFRDTGVLPVASRVFLIGYPGEVETSPKPTIVAGVLSRTRHWPAAGLTYLQTDAATAGGQSGGALLDADGRLLGISGFKFTDASYALALSSEDIVPVVDKMKLGLPPSILGNRRLPPYGGDFGAEIAIANRWRSQRFAFEVARSMPVRFEPNCDGEGQIRILNAHQELHQTHAGVEEFERTLSKGGLHFLEIRASSDRPLTCHLTGSVLLTPLNDPDDARILNLGDSLAGSIDFFFDTDWYILELDENERIEVTTDSLNADTVVHVHCISCGAGQFATDDDGGGGLFEYNAQVVYLTPQKGRYFVIVSSFEDDVGGYYLSVDRASSRARLTEVQASPPALEPPSNEQLVDSIYACISSEGELRDYFVKEMTETLVAEGMTEAGARTTALSWLENEELMLALIRSAADSGEWDPEDQWYQQCASIMSPDRQAPVVSLPTGASDGASSPGSKSGSIEHNPSRTTIKSHHAGVRVKDAIISATFTNPYGAQSGPWDYGFYIRNDRDTKDGTFMYLVVRSDWTWKLKWRDRATEITQAIQEGTVRNLNTGQGEENTLWVAFFGNRGVLFVNDEFVSALDFSSSDVTGDVAVITGVFRGNERAGAATRYRDLRVLALKNTHGPVTQRLHPASAPGGHLPTGVAAGNAIMEARFLVASGSPWERAFGLVGGDNSTVHTAGADHRGMWFHRTCQQDACTVQSEGQLARTTGHEVSLMLFAFGTNGFLFVDDEFVAPLDLSGLAHDRQILLAVRSSDATDGTLEMRNFSVWTVD